MQRGLEGRRIALFTPAGDETNARAARAAGVVMSALEQAGARIHQLGPDQDETDWHGAKYAGLVLIGDDKAEFAGDTRVVQLVREFLVSEKPVAALGSAVSLIAETGGAAGRTLAAQGPLKASVEAAGGTSVDEPIHADGALVTASATADVEGFAARVVQEFSTQLEEHALDEMSDLSFPASDPPASTPSSIGKVSRDTERDSRP